jgi:hypothetical protein
MPVLHHHRRDLTAALQTIIGPLSGNRFAIEFFQEGLLRPPSANACWMNPLSIGRIEWQAICRDDGGRLFSLAS